MLFSYGRLDEAERRVLDRIADLRARLQRQIVENPRPWTGLLIRMTRARALRASNEVGGVGVSDEDALAAVDGEALTDADRPARQSIEGYQSAMNFILQRGRGGNPRFSADMILAAHFMLARSDPEANPGNWRPGWGGVRDTQSGELAHEGVDRYLLEPLMDELVADMNAADVHTSIVCGAMTHLNVVMLRPFSDGNGRAARCLQAAVLRRDGAAAPIFSGIEDYISNNRRRYYDVLAEVGGGGWNPARDVKPWIRFCLTGHYQQAQSLLYRFREFERVHDELERLVLAGGLPKRAALALVEAAFGLRVRNSSYRVTAEVSNNLSSRDLKGLVDVELLTPEGEKRGRDYVASPGVLEIRDSLRLPTGAGDPFDE